MNIQVRSYGAMSDFMGKSTNVEIPEGGSILDLTRALTVQFPAAALLMPSCVFAIANTFASIDTQLHPGQEVAILPPASGG